MKLLFENWRGYLTEAKVEKRIAYEDALIMAEEIIVGLGLQYWDPDEDPSEEPGEVRFRPGVGIPVGSIRQEKETIGDIDILSTEPVSIEQVEALPGVSNLSARGQKQIFFDFTSPQTGITRPINIFVSPDPQFFGGMLMHTTGPGRYNVHLRMIAKRAGGKANQYGVFDKDGKQIGGETESSYYKALKSKKNPEGKEWKHPSLRGK